MLVQFQLKLIKKMFVVYMQFFIFSVIINQKKFIYSFLLFHTL